jgi:hypothetical protein
MRKLEIYNTQHATRTAKRDDMTCSGLNVKGFRKNVFSVSLCRYDSSGRSCSDTQMFLGKM